MYPYLMAAGLAVFLSVPVGPVGFAAGERGAAGHWREFGLIGLGCIAADVLLAVLAVGVMAVLPQFEVGDLYRYAEVWLALGLALVLLGLYLMLHPPTGERRDFRYPFGFGFGVTFVWPTSFGGIFGAFGLAHVAGWLPADMTGRLLVALCLGLGTTTLWLGWGLLCRWLSRRVGVGTLARGFHWFMSGSVVLGGLVVMTKPYFV